MKPTLIPESYALLPLLTAPASPIGGQIYLDGSVSPAIYRQWNDVTLAWEIFGAGGNVSTPIVARAYVSTPQFTDNTLPINFDTVDFDSNASITTGAAWKFTASDSGYYNISTTLLPTASGISIAVYKNGTIIAAAPWLLSVTTTVGYLSGSTIIQLNAGDYVDLRADAAGITISEGAINISRAAGMASASSIAASAYMAVNTAVGPNAVIPWDTEYFDTNNALSAGVFTAPVTGFYQVSGTIQISGSTTDIQSFKNGSLRKYLTTPNTLNVTFDYGDLVQLNAGDTYSINVVAACTINSVGATPLSYFSIVLISAEAGLTAPTRVSAYLSANQVLAANDTIIFDTVVSDINSLYNSVTGVITIADTGAYSLSGVFQSASGTANIAAKINGTITQYMCGAGTAVSSGYIVLDLVAGNTVEIIGDTISTISGQSAPKVTSFTLLKI